VVALAAGAYQAHVFAPGFSAHWVRFRAQSGGRVTVEIVYN
jgi:hypothetical protein